MRSKADSEDVNRILDALLEQGNGEEIGFWVWDHMCWECPHKKKEPKPEVAGFIEWGNGEPCPICGKEFKEPDMDHLMSHPEAMKILYPTEEVKKE